MSTHRLLWSLRSLLVGSLLAGSLLLPQRCAWSAPPMPPPTGYTVTVIGLAAPGVARSHPSFPGAVTADGLDEDGTVAGTIFTVGHAEAAILSPVVLPLGALNPATDSFANAIRNGTVVGYGFGGKNNDFNHAFRWTLATGLEDINTTALLSIAQAIS